jgi:hypothetical protein
MLQAFLDGHLLNAPITSKAFSEARLGSGITVEAILGKLDCNVAVGTHGYGDSFEIPRISVSLSTDDLRRIALAILAVVLGPKPKLFLPIRTAGPTQGMTFFAARPPAYPVQDVKSFTYNRSLPVKRYPWYPQSLRWDPLQELPAFGLGPIPASHAHLTSRGRINLEHPHAVSVDGYPLGLVRLARLLLDYANASEPPEDVCFEIERVDQ